MSVVTVFFVQKHVGVVLKTTVKGQTLVTQPRRIISQDLGASLTYRACFVIFWGAQNIVGERSLKITDNTIAVNQQHCSSQLANECVTGIIFTNFIYFICSYLLLLMIVKDIVRSISIAHAASLYLYFAFAFAFSLISCFHQLFDF